MGVAGIVITMCSCLSVRLSQDNSRTRWWMSTKLGAPAKWLNFGVNHGSLLLPLTLRDRTFCDIRSLARGRHGAFRWDWVHSQLPICVPFTFRQSLIFCFAPCDILINLATCQLSLCVNSSRIAHCGVKRATLRLNENCRLYKLKPLHYIPWLRKTAD